MAEKNITDKIYEKMDERQTPLCIGLDPVMEKIPLQIREEAIKEFGTTYQAAAESIKRFNYGIIEATSDLVLLNKPQSAYYEKYGHWGIKALEDTVKFSQDKGAIVILDAKRNDIGRTSEAYAEAHLGKVMLPDGTFARSPDDLDLMTVNGYLGSDGIKPFIEVANRDNKGLFVLAKTSNKSSGELQDLLIRDGPEIYMKMSELIREWGKDNIGINGYSNVGAVVGATFPEEAKRLRGLLPHTMFLMPGYDTQGAEAKTLVNGFDQNGRGAIVSSSSGLNFAYLNKEFAERHPDLAKPEKFAEATRRATIESIVYINNALRKADKLPKEW